MRFVITAFLSGLRARLAGWRTWILLLLLPLAAFGTARLLPPEEVSAPVQVGVVLPQEGGGAFWDKLQARNGLVVTFQTASLFQASRQVAAGRWDCALVLPEDFSARLATLDTGELFTLLIGPGSAAYPLVRETVTACLAECISPAMAEGYLLDSGILSQAGLPAARPRLQEVLEDRDRVLVALETVDGAPLDPLTLADSGVSGLTAGLTAVLLLIWALFTAMDLGRWLDSPFARRLAPLRGATALLLPRLAGGMLPALCAGGLALLAAGAPASCVPALVPYLLFWGGAALLLARSRVLWSALPVLTPFVPVAGLLFSPMLLDLSLLFPVLEPAVRWNPISLYLRACGGGLWDSALLVIGGGVLLILSLAMDKNRRTSEY